MGGRDLITMSSEDSSHLKEKLGGTELGHWAGVTLRNDIHYSAEATKDPILCIVRNISWPRLLIGDIYSHIIASHPTSMSTVLEVSEEDALLTDLISDH